MPTSNFINSSVNGLVGGVKSAGASTFSGAASAVGNLFDGVSGAIGDLLGIFTSQTTEKHVTLNLLPSGVGSGIKPDVVDFSGLNRLNTARPVTKNISAEMKNSSKNYEYDVYPPELDFSKYWMEIQFGEYVRPYFGDDPNSPTSFNPSYSVNIPLPPQLSDAQVLGWQTGNLGATGLAMNYLQKNNIINPKTKMDTINFGAIKDSLSGILPEKTDVNSILASNLGQTISYYAMNSNFSVLGVNLAQAIGNVIGYSPNPFPGAWYVGPDLRQFQFSWIFVPESREDSSKIKRIINQIRKRTLSEPSGQLGAFLKYPEICRIRLHPDKLHAVFPFKECALTGINVDYSPYGLSFHNDQNPTAIGLGLVFAEIRPLFRTDFDNDPENTDLSSEYKDLTSQDVKDAFDPSVFAR